MSKAPEERGRQPPKRHSFVSPRCQNVVKRFELGNSSGGSFSVLISFWKARRVTGMNRRSKISGGSRDDATGRVDAPRSGSKTKTAKPAAKARGAEAGGSTSTGRRTKSPARSKAPRKRAARPRSRTAAAPAVASASSASSTGPGGSSLLGSLPVAPSYEEIARLAYEIYEAEGRPNGQALSHWLQAEAALSSRPLAQA